MAATPLPAADKALLQASMQRYIERGLVDGAWLTLDPVSGNVAGLHPDTAHPMILRMGPHFVLCSDFRDSDGHSVNVDFYMARSGKSFVVFQMAIAERERLERLIRAGKAVAID